MKLYKLTEKDMTTYEHSTLWGEGVTHSIKMKKSRPVLCSGDVLHAYVNLNLAFLLNPIHANVFSPLVYEAEGEVVVKDFGKVGCFSLTTVKQIPAPEWTESKSLSQRVRIAFAVLCAERVLSLFESRYPSDKRPRNAISAAKNYLLHPSDAARAAASIASTAAAHAAVYAAADHDIGSAAAFAADAAADAASATAYAAVYTTADIAAADAASYADYAATYANLPEINFGELADLAVELAMVEE